MACASEGRGHCGRRNQQGRGEEGGQAGCKPGFSAHGMDVLLLLCSPLLRGELAAACALHLWRRCCSLRQGALGLLARIKQRGFRIHSPVGDLQPRSGVRFTHSFFWTMPSPSAPAALSYQFLFKQARFYKSQGAAPGIRDQFL